MSTSRERARACPSAKQTSTMFGWFELGLAVQPLGPVERFESIFASSCGWGTKSLGGGGLRRFRASTIFDRKEMDAKRPAQESRWQNPTDWHREMLEKFSGRP